MKCPNLETENITVRVITVLMNFYEFTKHYMEHITGKEHTYFTISDAQCI